MYRSKERFRDFVAAEGSVPLFQTPFWLDATVGEANWDVVLIEESGQVIAALPFFVRKKLGLQILTQPSLSPFLGPWVAGPIVEGKDVGRWHSLLFRLSESLPSHAVYRQAWDPKQTNWLPLYWLGFRQTTAYTYVIDRELSEEEVIRGYSRDLRRSLRAAEGASALETYQGEEPELVLELARASFERKKLKASYDNETVLTAFRECRKRNQATTLIVRDPSGSAHAGGLFVWDHDSIYYLIGGVRRNSANPNASRLVLHRAIQLSRSLGLTFNFEGSMVRSIECLFRSFGPVQVQYSLVERYSSKLLQLLSGRSLG